MYPILSESLARKKYNLSCFLCAHSDEKWTSLDLHQEKSIRSSVTLVCFRFEEMSCLDGGRGAHPRRGDDLTKVRVCRFARREDSSFAGLHFVVNLDVTEIVHFQLVFEQSAYSACGR